MTQNSIYPVNKNIGKPVVFRGLKGQYVWYLGIGLAVLLLAFAVLYIAGIPVMFCLVLVAGCGATLFYTVYKNNARYGEHGWMKRMAQRDTPKQVYCDKFFMK